MIYPNLILLLNPVVILNIFVKIFNTTANYLWILTLIIVLFIILKINYIGAEPQLHYRNNSHRFTDFQKSFLIYESVTKKRSRASKNET